MAGNSTRVSADLRELSSGPQMGYSVTVERVCEFFGFDRTSVYEMLEIGQIELITVGRRRLVLNASLEAIIRVNAAETPVSGGKQHCG